MDKPGAPEPATGEPESQPINWLDRTIAYFMPMSGVRRALARRTFASLTGYESAQPSRKRRFHQNTRSGDALSRVAAQPIRNQARWLDRNSDVARGGLDKLVDFTVGPNGIMVEPQPKGRDGSTHQDFAADLARDWTEYCKRPEVTWQFDWSGTCRVVARTAYRDGEDLAQMISGPRIDQAYSTDVPFALELLEPDFLPHEYDDYGQNIRQAIQRNNWGRPTGYYVYLQHPGDTYGVVSSGANPLVFTSQTKRISADQMLHVRFVDRQHTLRGTSLLASVIPRLQDIQEYEDSERIAAKMASNLVLKLTRGTADMWNTATSYDPNKPPVYQMEGGMIVVNSAPGESADFFDTKRPNVGAEPFIESQLRRASAGFGLSYSAISRNYNGTYSAQRQELVENHPHYQACTMVLVAQFARPTYERWVTMRILAKGMPRDVDPATVFDADYLGPPMPQIDPEKEANANLMLVQACFKSSSQVIRERSGNTRQTYADLAHEKKLREQVGITSTVDVGTAGVSQAKPSSPDTSPGTTTGTSGRVVPITGRREADTA